jgi:chemotaxis protein MotB
MRGNKKPKKDNSERWLLTYSDLITLLMTFFVILYAFSSVDQQKYEELSVSFNKALGNGSIIGKGASIKDGQNGVLEGGSPADEPGNQTSEDSTEDTKDTTEETSEQSKEQKAEAAEQSQIRTIEKEINNIISRFNLEDDMDIIIQENGLVISFSNNLFFDSGKTNLKKEMKAGLDQIAVEINKIDNEIQVKGYTDNVPVKNSIYSSNWQLSAVRAANVVQYLIEEGNVKGTRLTAVGCGENDPVATNSTEKGRSKNRRIEMIILFKYKNTSK